MGQWMKLLFAVILCIGGSALAEDVTYSDDPGSKPIQWVDVGNGHHGQAILGPEGTDTGTSDSISGNTVTIKNITMPPPEEPTQIPVSRIEVYGAINSLDSAPVTGNTVILENAILEHDIFEENNDPSTWSYSVGSVYGGHAGGQAIRNYGGTPVANANHVKIRNSSVGSVTGGAAEDWPVYEDENLGNYLNLGKKPEASGNTIEVSDGSMVEYVEGGSAFLMNGPFVNTEFTDEVQVAANAHVSANGNQVKITDSTVGDVVSGDAYINVDFVAHPYFSNNPADIPTDSVDVFPVTVNGTLAATASDNSMIIENSKTRGDNDTEDDAYIEGGYAEARVYVSDKSDLTVTATAARNHVTINGGGVEIKGNIFGGRSELRTISDTGAAIAGDNSVTINGGTVNAENDVIMGGGAHSEGYRGGYSWNEPGGDLYDPLDDIRHDVEINIPDSFGIATTTGNSVTINGGSVMMRKVDIVDDPSDNFLPDDDEDVGLFGGLAEAETGVATAKDNKLIITGGTVEVEGDGMTAGAAISESGSAIAMGNIVAISGGKVTGNVYGGYAESKTGVATATGNIFEVSGAADLSNASLFGGGTSDGMEANHTDNDFFTGNTLNVLSEAAIQAAQNFQNVNFGYSGDANIGTFDLSGGDVQLSVTDANTINYTGTFSGAGSLTKLGTGVLNFGSNKSIGGKMTVREGGLSISKSLSLTTNGGLLFGAGSQFTPNGNTLSVLGGLTVDKGALINLSDIDVGKTVLVSDSRIGGDFDSMFYETMMNDEMTELRVIGEFNSGDKGKNIISDLANSGVTMGKNGVKGIGQLASILGSVGPEVERELMRQLEVLVDLADSGDRAAAAAGVQQILGQYSTRATQATHTVAQSFGSAVSGHLSQMRDSRMAQAGMNSAPGAQSNRAYASMRTPRNTPRYARGGYGYSSAANRIWGGGFGSFASQDDDDGDFGYDYNSGGFILGYDHYFGDNLTVGFTGAYSHGTIDGNDGYSETSVDTLNFGAYASYDTQSGFYAEGNLGFGFTWNDEDERLVWGGRRSGEFGTSSFQLGGNVGYAFQLPAAFRIIPTVGLQYIHVDQDEYQQSGNVLAMWRDSSSADYLEVPIAVRVNKTFELGNGVSITPELRAAWIIEAKQDDVSVRTGFVGSNASMLVSGVNPGKHRGLVGLGAKARLGGNVDAFLNYNLEFRNNYTNHNIMAGVGVSF